MERIYNLSALSVSAIIFIIVYFQLITIPISVYLLIGIILVIIFCYNIYIYLRITRAPDGKSSVFLGKYSLPFISSLYIGIVGILRVAISNSEYPVQDAVLIAGGIHFFFGVWSFFILTFIIRLLIRFTSRNGF